MTPERYQRIGQLFDEALELAPEDRIAFLEQASGADRELCTAVEKLLANHSDSEEFLSRPAMEVAAALFAQNQTTTIGKQISHYKILSLLGVGGMGQVYLAKDMRLNRKVALKLLPIQFTRDVERVRRFQQEAQAASALNHPNILTIFDIDQPTDETDNTHFIATEYVEGKTLRQLLQEGPLAPPQVIEIAIQLADALNTAHAVGIIHRDIKPENVMRRTDGYVKVLDFGLAKLTEQSQPSLLTDPGKVMGTISYMSPEQALGLNVDQRTDIFSLGVVLYELLSGVQPFKGDSDAATYNAILNHQPPSLTQTQYQLPGELAAIIERALQKDREARYQTAAELRAALQLLQRDSASQSAAVALPIVKHLRWQLPLIAAVLLLLVAGGAYLLQQWSSQRRSPTETPRATLSTLPIHISFTQQTDQPGIEYFPALSPDGQTLIYVSQESGNWDLWQQSIGQRNRVNLTSDAPGEDTQPAYAPDGKHIAFRSSRDGGGVFVLDLSSRAVKKISNEGFNPAWSPNGSEIAYGTENVRDVESRSKSQLWAINIASGEKRMLVAQDAVQPAWSPNGQRLAFWGFEQNGLADLWTVPALGGLCTRITNDVAIDWNPCWSADGKYLYFTSDRGGNQNLWRVAIDETTGQVLSAPEAVTTPSAYTQHLSIARDGRHLVYVQRNKQRQLQSIPFDPVTETVRGIPFSITRGSTAATHTSISPDGQWLAYSSTSGPQEDIYIIRTDGTDLRQLTNDAAKDRLPRWSPDGKRIAFYSDRENKNEIWAVAPSGQGTLEQITFVGDGRAMYPTWSPDGNSLAYYLFGRGSFILNLQKSWEQQTPQPVVVSGSEDNDLRVWDWSPDGQKLACFQHRPGSQALAVAVYSFATREAAPRLEMIAENADYSVWLNDSQHLLLEIGGKMFLGDTRGKALRQIYAPGQNGAAEYFDISPDNRTIYFSLTTIEADIWLMKLAP